MIELAQADLAELVGSKDQKAIEQKVQKQLDMVNTPAPRSQSRQEQLGVVGSAFFQCGRRHCLDHGTEANDALTADVAPRAASAGGVSEEQTAAADRIITLAMTAPERLDTTVVAKLAADKNNALAFPQRDLRCFRSCPAIQPYLTSSHVSEDIYAGNMGTRVLCSTEVPWAKLWLPATRRWLIPN